ncbi:UNVERIFIED_CONTAM: hypothetical protein FKN15_012301 [Acipenser sinensis]
MMRCSVWLVYAEVQCIARLQRGNLLLKQGKLDEAEEDFKKVLKSSPSAKEEADARTQLIKCDQMQRLLVQTHREFNNEDYRTATAQLDTLLETCVWDVTLRELRAECYIQLGELGKAISDLKAATKLKNDNTAAFYKISTIYYKLGDHEMSNQQAHEAIETCTEVLKSDPHNVNVLKDRAEAYLLDEQYHEAVRDYETAQEHNESDPQVKEGLERAQRLLKQSQKRDYYKILGVKRNAQKKEIIKAYRKQAQQWHPDNFQDEEEKKKAEQKFIDIASAKEVLTDPEDNANGVIQTPKGFFVTL